MDNLSWWEQLANPDPGAIREIKAGRLRGKHDINPQWRYLAMTRLFGPVGVGWKFEVTRQWTEPGADGEVLAFVNVHVFVRAHPEGAWSDPIPGTGGNTLVAKEKGGFHNNDEAFKMATTDALGTAMKLLGVAAEVYMGGFDSKYDREREPPREAYKPAPRPDFAARSRDLRDTFVSRLKLATTREMVRAIHKDVTAKKAEMTPNDYQTVADVGNTVQEAFRQAEGIP